MCATVLRLASVLLVTVLALCGAQGGAPGARAVRRERLVDRLREGGPRPRRRDVARHHLPHADPRQLLLEGELPRGSWPGAIPSVVATRIHPPFLALVSAAGYTATVACRRGAHIVRTA